MGSMYEAQCPCGYASDTLFEGCGMAGPDTCRNLARCHHCQEIVSIGSSSARPRCPKCRRKVQVITIEPTALVDSQSVPGPVKLECPRCGNSTLVLAELGCWD
jgi:hypothetical protein